MLIELKNGTTIETESEFKNLKDIVAELVTQYGITKVLDAIDDSDELLDWLDNDEIELYMQGW